MRIIASLAAGAALTLAAPVAAQDETEPFSGAYAGVSVGYDIQKNDRGATVQFDRDLNGDFDNTVLTGAGGDAFAPGFCNGAATSTAPSACRNDRDDVSYSVRLGFDKQFGNLVAGVVGEFGKSEIRDSTTGFSVTPANYVFTREIDWEAALRLRLGYAANTTLFYATGGPSYARIDSSFRSSQSTNTFTGSGSKNEWGFNAGGGIEQKLGRNFSVGLEFMHHRYNDDDYRVRIAGGPAAAPFTPFTNPTNGGTAAGTDARRSDDRFAWHSIKATAAFRF